MILIALALGALFAWGLARRGFVRQLLDVLTPAPLVFLALFIFFSDTHKLIFPAEDANALGVKVESHAPIVFVTIDELPRATLMDASGRRIDAKRFPGFARLAQESTWYRNNTSVADFTGRAVPAIMTGNSPEYTTLPISSDQPNSIFSLLGGKYKFNVTEVVTQVCPSDLCGNEDEAQPPQRTRLKSLAEDLRYVEGKLILPPAMANDLPDVSATFGNFGNNGGSGQYAGQFAQDLFRPPSPGEFQRFLGRIPPKGGRSLNFIHMELPHEPFHFLPDSREYNFAPISDVAGPNAQKWAAGVGGVGTTWQRHFIQTGYADHLVSQMLDRLHSSGVWDKAMVIVTADHGISFDPKDYRRIAAKTNLGGVGNPPLFIKYPGQKSGEVSEVHTETIDIVPTIADVLGIDLPYRTDGRPISEDDSSRDVVMTTGLKTTVRAPFSAMLADRERVLREQSRQLGTGNGLFELGPRPDLLGAPAPPADAPGGAASAELNDPAAYANVSFAHGRKIPAFAVATLDRVKPQSLIAIAANGRVAATARAFLFDGKTWAGAILPPDSLRPGSNSVGFYLVGTGGELTPLGGT